MKNYFFILVFVCLTFAGNVHASDAPDVAFITMVAGTAVVDAPGKQRNAIALTKLRSGERLLLKKDSHLRIVYMNSGRQETWKGEATLAIGSDASAKITGDDPEVRKIPAALCKQLWKTPGGESNSRVGMARLRDISKPNLAEVEKNYSAARAETTGDDRTPELYLLAALFDLGKYDRIETVLTDLKGRNPNSTEVGMITERYAKAINQARNAAKKAP